MDSYKNVIPTQKVPSKKSVENPSVEERLRIFANLIVDRILEDQKNGIVRTPATNQK